MLVHMGRHRGVPRRIEAEQTTVPRAGCAGVSPRSAE
jgi:hypothetical protein